VFTGLMANTWIAATIVAVIAGVMGFFAVLRGQSFAAHAIPNGAFAGAAGAGLLGLNVIWGLAVFAVGGALGIGALGRRARQDVVTALVLVLMLGTGALFVGFSTEYAQVTYSLLFGEVYGIGSSVLLPIAALGAASVAVIAVMYRPLLLASALPDVADARGVSTRRMELCFLIVMALATSMTVPVVGALLMFALMIGPAAAARSFARRPEHAIALAVAIALATVWIGIVASYRTNWPLGFFVGVIAAGFFLIGQGWSVARRRWFAVGAVALYPERFRGGSGSPARQVGGKPVPGQGGGHGQRARLPEQVGRARDDLQPVLAAQAGLSLAVEVEHDVVLPADDEQGRRGHRGEPARGKVGTPAAGDHGGDVRAGFGGGRQRRRRAGARAEVADGRPGGGRLGAQPVSDLAKAAGEQADVEHVRPVEFLLPREQVEEQGAEPGFVQHPGDVLVARAVPTAAAAVREHHDPRRLVRHGQVAG